MREQVNVIVALAALVEAAVVLGSELAEEVVCRALVAVERDHINAERAFAVHALDFVEHELSAIVRFAVRDQIDGVDFLVGKRFLLTSVVRSH